MSNPAVQDRPSGKWRTTDMDKWDADVLDLVVPAFMEFRRDRTGSFRFIARARVEFTWEGNDECDPASTAESALTRHV